MSFDSFAGVQAYTPALTPFLPSYDGLSGAELQAYATLQSQYNPQAPMANQEQAIDYLRSAMQATDPALRRELLERALELLQRQEPRPLPAPASSGGPAGAPSSGPALPGGPGNGVSELTADPSNNTVDTGRYLITASKDRDGSLTIHDKETGEDLVIWGDPHVEADGKHVADFQKDNLSIQLQDGTTIYLKPTDQNSNGKAWLDQVAITKGDDAVTMSGFHEGSLHTSAAVDGNAEYAESLFDTPDINNVTLGDDGDLYYNNADGSMGAEIGTDGVANLDDAGGGRVGEPARPGTLPAGSAEDPALMAQLQQAIMENTSGMMQAMMLSLLSQMISSSGYAQA